MKMNYLAFLVASWTSLQLCFGVEYLKKDERFLKRPNVVFILTDDQDLILGGMTPLPKVQKLLAEKGVSFNNMFVTTPICCPSRSSILTGLYQHNHRTMNNSISGNCSSTYWQSTAEKQTFAVHAQNLGYRTMFSGKYLNQYGKSKVHGTSHIPPGWDSWLGLVGNSRYYNYTLSDDGVSVKHGDNYHKDYLTDLLANRSIDFIEKNTGFLASPFLVMISTPACHSPWDSAPQYAKQYTNMTAPKTPSYDHPGKDKHWLIRDALNPMHKNSVAYLTNAFQSRWRTLKSVDDLVEKVVNTLNKTGQLDNTYIIFTSDNGYHMGQFSLPIDKRQLYEFDIRVPLLVRGPGIAPNITLNQTVLAIDLAPTIVDIANAGNGFPLTMDGNSFRPFLLNSSAKVDWRDDFLVEYQGEGKNIPQKQCNKGPGVAECLPETDCDCQDSFNNTYSCVRTLSQSKNLMYCEFTDDETFVELYNMTNDPHQLTNIRNTVDPQVLVNMNQRLIKLGLCSAKTCRSKPHYSTKTWPR